MGGSNRALVLIFSAVVATTFTLILIAAVVVGFKGEAFIEAQLWVALAAGLATLLCLLWAAMSALRGLARAEATAAALRKTEAALRETEMRFSAVADNARAAFGILVGTRLIYANRYFSELTGYSNEEILSMDFREMTHPAFHELMVDRARRRLAGEPVPSHYEFRAVTKSGEEKWIDFSPAVTELDGKPVIIGTGFDVTERHRAEAALKESEEKFRLLAESSKVFICIFRDRRFLYANPFLAEVSGYTQEELLAMDTAELIPPEDREMVLDRVRRRQAGEVLPPSYEYKLLDKSGEAHWVELWGVRIEYQGSPAVLAAGIDVTFRRRAQEELRRNEEQFRLLAEATPQMVWIAGPDGSLEYFNGRCYEYGGTNFDEAKGDGWSKWLHPDDYQRTLNRWSHSIKTGEPYDIEHRFRRASDGAYRWFLGRALPLRDEAGTIIRWFGTSTEIHELKQLQEQLSAAQHSAEQAQKTAEEASRAKDHFIAMLSHELRTPLTPVLAAVSMLQKNPLLDARTTDGLEMIRRNVELEARLIDDLLDLTRIARGRIELDKRPVDLCTVIHRAVEVCGPDIKARDLHFGIAPGADPPYFVEADVGRLQQVFWNLLKNSIKFTPHGGCIGIRCRSEAGQVVVEVNDSGMGIESEALLHIFDAFAQAAVARQFGGLGLGLAITKSLVELHGGTVEAHSEGKGKGATFTVRLPRIAAPASVPAPAAPPPRQRSLRLLVVEDHGDTAEMIKLMLESEGHEVTLTGDMDSALEQASQRTFDLLISDLGLPGGSGLDLLHELQSRGQQLPAIALSGYGQEADIAQSRAAGFSAHVVKPIDFDRLVAVLANVSPG